MLMTTYKKLLVTIMVLKFLSIMMMRQKNNNATTIVTAFSSTTFSSTFTQSLKTSRIIRSSGGNSSHGPFRKSQIVMMPEGPEVRTLVDQLQPGVGLRLCDLQVCRMSIIMIMFVLLLLLFCIYAISKNKINQNWKI